MKKKTIGKVQVILGIIFLIIGIVALIFLFYSHLINLGYKNYAGGVMNNLERHVSTIWQQASDSGHVISNETKLQMGFSISLLDTEVLYQTLYFVVSIILLLLLLFMGSVILILQGLANIADK